MPSLHQEDSEFDIESAVSQLSADLFGEEDHDDIDDNGSSAGGADDTVSLPDATTTPPPGPDEAPVAAPVAAEKTTTLSAPEAVAAPKTWRPEAAAMWSQLPPTIQAEIAKRESDIFSGIEQYKGLADAGRTFQQTLAPYFEHFKASGSNPVQVVSNLLSANHILSRGTPDQKLQLVRAIISDSGLSPDDLLAEAPYVDPAVSGLRSEVTSLKTQLQQREQRELETQRATLQSQVETFFSDPGNKYANEVATEMHRLIVSKQATDLRSAYEQAIWLNPVVRGKVLAEQQAEASRSAERAAAEKSAAAKSAASANVRSTPKRGGTAASTPKSIDDTLQETLAAINARP